MELGQKSSWRLIKSIWWSAPVTDPYHLEEVHYSILCFLDICKSPLFLGTPIPVSDDFMFVFLVCQDIISPFGGFAVRPFFPSLLSHRKCLIQGIVQENTYQNMLGSLGSKVWIFDMAGHGCLISWCFNVCNSIERVFQPGIMHFHFFLMRFLDIFVENGLGGRGNREEFTNLKYCQLSAKGEHGNQVKPATKKEKATEVEVQPLPYTQILRMVQVIFRCGVDVGGIEAWMLKIFKKTISTSSLQKQTNKLCKQKVKGWER